MKRLLTLPLIFLFVGCGGSDGQDVEVDPEMEAQMRSELNAQCNYLSKTVKNSDELLSCEVALEECSTVELWTIVNKWTCDVGDDPIEGGDCLLDDNGDRQPFLLELTDACAEGMDSIVPLDNGLADDISWMWSTHKLPSSNWCGPGDLKSDTKGVQNGVDGACRRHDHGDGYNEGGANSHWWTLWQDLPKAQCGVDADIVAGASAQSGHSTTKWAINFVFNATSWYPCRAQDAHASVGYSYSCRCGWWGCSTCYGTRWEWGNKNVSGSDKAPWHNLGVSTYADGCKNASLTAQGSCL